MLKITHLKCIHRHYSDIVTLNEQFETQNVMNKIKQRKKKDVKKEVKLINLDCREA